MGNSDHDESVNHSMSKPKQTSDILFTEQIVSESSKLCNGKVMSHLTLLQYQNMSSEQRSHVQNRVRQWALKARHSMPSDDHGLFCLVAAHLLRNAHKYFNLEAASQLQKPVLEEKMVSEPTCQRIIDDFKEANKTLWCIGDLKDKNRVSEQQRLVCKMKEEYQTFRNMSFMSGISVKTVHKTQKT